MSFDSGVNVSEVECVEFTREAIDRMDSLGGDIVSHLMHPITHKSVEYSCNVEKGHNPLKN